MLSSIPSSILSQNFSQNTTPRQYSFENLQQCPQFQAKLEDIAIRRISSDLLKSLVSIKRIEFEEARTRVDIPHGLFGLKLDDFYTRCKEKPVYIDVLQMVCNDILEKAKFSIILDDVQEFVSRLFIGYHNQDMGAILKEIVDAEKLLTIGDIITAEFKTNSIALQKLRDKLNTFNVHERNTTIYVNSQVYAVQQNCFETACVIDPIEYRFKLKYHAAILDQREYKLHHAGDKLQEALKHMELRRIREETVSECIMIRQQMEIDMIRSKIDEMTDKHNREYDDLDGQITYKLNAMEAMRTQHNECLEKMRFFASEIPKLREWKEAFELKKTEELAKTVEKKPKKKMKGRKGRK